MVTKRMTGEERKQQIISVATELFAEKGFEQTTTKQIASKAGINEAMIYKHFAGKEELYDSAVDRFIQGLSSAIDTLYFDMPDEMEDRLKKFITLIINFWDENAASTRMFLQSALKDHRFTDRFFNAFSKRILTFMVEKIRHGQKQGKFRRDVNPKESAVAFFGAFVLFNLGRNILKFEEIRRISPEEYVDNAVKIFMRGISAVTAEGEAK